MDKWEYQNKPFHLENRVVTEPCNQRTSYTPCSNSFSFYMLLKSVFLEIKEENLMKCNFINYSAPKWGLPAGDMRSFVIKFVFAQNLHVTMDAQWSLFSLKYRTFGLGQTNWADNFEAFGVFSAKNINTHFGTMSPLSMLHYSTNISTKD